MRLSLAGSGLEWTHSAADGEHKSGLPLIEAVARSEAALASVRALVVSADSNFAIPLDRIRQGGEPALAALREMSFFSAEGGPRRTEVFFMADVLRRNRRPELVTEDESAASEVALTLLEEVQQGGRVPRAKWEARLKELIVGGDLRRATLATLISAEALRAVGFGVHELQAIGWSLSELRLEGRFTAAELKEAGVAADELKALGYSVSEMRKAAVSASELMPMGWSAAQMKAGGFSAPELKAGGYALGALAEGGFTAKELKSAAFGAAELRGAGFSVSQLRAADFKADTIRAAGYSVKEMASGFSTRELSNVGFTAKELKAGGLAARELRSAGGFKVKMIKDAGYTIEEMKAAGIHAKELEKVGCTLPEMLDGGFTASDLREDGYEWHELVIECRLTYEQLLAAGFSAGKKGFGEGMDPDHALFRELKKELKIPKAIINSSVAPK